MRASIWFDDKPSVYAQSHKQVQFKPSAQMECVRCEGSATCRAAWICCAGRIESVCAHGACSARQSNILRVPRVAQEMSAATCATVIVTGAGERRVDDDVLTGSSDDAHAQQQHWRPLLRARRSVRVAVPAPSSLPTRWKHDIHLW